MGRQIHTYLLALAVMCLAALSQTLALKADIGVTPCWDSLAMNVSEIAGIKVGTFTMAMGILMVLLQWSILRKKFLPVRFLQIPGVILYGAVMNLFYYQIMNFEIHHYTTRVILVLLSVVGMAFFLGVNTCLNVIPTPTEAAVYVLADRTGCKFGVLRWAVDGGCVTASLSLSFLFGLSVKIREGTVIGMLLLGPLMGWFIIRQKRWLCPDSD